MCIDDAGDLQSVEGVEIERADGCAYTSAEYFYCSGAYAQDAEITDFLCDGTDLIEEALYPECK
jgi:hypothetical protein